MIYRSNITAPDLQPFFTPVLCKPRHWSRVHDALSDPDFEPECCFMTHDEVAILYEIGKRLGGTWVDIGSRFGWTSAHLAISGCSVTAVDPGYRDGAFYQRAKDNIERACRGNHPVLVPQTSEEFFADVRIRNAFTGVCIDGNHDAPYPEMDAQLAAAHLKQTGAIVFHDVWGKPIRDGLNCLISIGFKCRVYDTPNGMAVCWTGDFTPPDHTPDPAIDWAGSRKSRARDFDFSRCS